MAGIYVSPLIHLVFFLLHLRITSSCLPCNCETVKEPPPGTIERVPIGKRVDCRNKSPGSSVWELKFPQETLELDLSDNGITSVRREALVQYTSLKKLDLSDNQITLIEPGAFLGLSNLVRLDLSNNKIGNINNTMFTGLSKLQKLLLTGNFIKSVVPGDFLGIESVQYLILARNQLKTVPEGSFRGLTALRKLDLQSDYLACDCHLQWIVRWSKSNTVRFTDETTCSVPHDLRGKPLKRLKRRDLHCEWPIELPLFELRPKKSQVVFQGDKLPFECRASVIDPQTKMIWVRHEQLVVTNKSEGILVHTAYSPDQSVMTHSLLIASLETSYTGVWKCVVQTSRGNVSKTVNIIVYAKDTKKCPTTTTRTNKGIFTWPKTISGIQASLPCTAGAASTYLGTSEPQATYTCDTQGRWVDLEDRQCQYVSEVTRVLEQYTITPMNVTNVLKLANRLKTYISNPRTIGDKIDLIYISRILDRFSAFVPTHNQLGSLLYGVVSDMMKVDRKLLFSSQVEDGACSRMTKLLERIPVQLLSIKKAIRIYTDNIALEGRVVSAENFPGMVCRAYRPLNIFEKYNEKTFTCSPKPKNKNETWSSLADHVKGLDGLIDLPSTLFQRLGGQYDKYRLQFIVYKNSNLFPITSGGSSLVQSLVSSTVLSSKISEGRVSNLSDPVVITLHTSKKGDNLRSVFWDYTANDGRGNWSTEGCTIKEQIGNITVAHCNHLTNFAILQDEVKPLTNPDMKGPWDVTLPWTAFLMEPVVYAGSGLCVICLMATILTYITCFSFIKIPKKAKHSLINTCFSILVLCVGYTMGVNRIDHEIGCKIVGIGLHYFSICALFWMTVSSSNMYKKFTKKDRPSPLPAEADEILEPPPPKPVLGFYFLSYGVPIIICGITVAVNMEHYIRIEYCFLAWEPSLGAFYGPAGLLILINCIFFICIACVLRGSPDIRDVEEETEDLNPQTEIESATENGEARLVRSESRTSMVDMEYRPINQLRALVLLLFLFVVMWTAGAFAAAAPFRNIIPHMKIIFSYVYGVVSAMLGIFVLVYFCLARIDTRTSWKRFFCCEKRADYDVHTNTINLTVMNGGVNGGINNGGNINGHLLQRASSFESELSHKTDKTNQSLTVAMTPRKESNINLVPSVTEASQNSGAEYAAHFYNPRQNGVARKFWQKHRKHNQLRLLNKDLNKEIPYQDKNINRRSDILRSDSPASDRKARLRFEVQLQNNKVEDRANFSASDSLPEYAKAGSLSESEPLPGSDPPPGYKSGITGSSGSELPLCNVLQDPVEYNRDYQQNRNNVSTLPIGYNGEYMRNDCFDFELEHGMYPDQCEHNDSPILSAKLGRSNRASSPTLPSPPPPSDPPPPLEFEPQYVPPDIGSNFYRPGMPAVLEHQRIAPMSDFNEPLLNNYSYHCDPNSGVSVRDYKENNYRKNPALFDSDSDRYMAMKSPHRLTRHSSRSRSPESDNQVPESLLRGADLGQNGIVRSSPESGNFSGGPRVKHPGDFMDEIEHRIPSYGIRHLSPAPSDWSDSNRHRGYKSGDSDSQSQSSINKRRRIRSQNIDNQSYTNGVSDRHRNRHSRTSRPSIERRESRQSHDSGSQSETGHALINKTSRSERQRSHDSCQSDKRLLSYDSGSQSESKLKSHDSSYQSGSDNKSKSLTSDGQLSTSSKHQRRGKRSARKQRSLDWDDQFKDKPKKSIPYAYVNYKYHEKMEKKTRHHSADEGPRDTGSDAYKFPRSVSAYDHGSRPYVDSDDSSSNESGEDIWVPRQQIKPFKNETSV